MSPCGEPIVHRQKNPPIWQNGLYVLGGISKRANQKICILIIFHSQGAHLLKSTILELSVHLFCWDLHCNEGCFVLCKWFWNFSTRTHLKIFISWFWIPREFTYSNQPLKSSVHFICWDHHCNEGWEIYLGSQNWWDYISNRCKHYFWVTLYLSSDEVG